MKINVWWCDSLKSWKYTIVDDSRPILKKDAGESENLKEAFKEIEKRVSSINKL